MGRVRASGAPDSSWRQPENGSRGDFVNSKLRASSTKTSQNRTNGSLHLPEGGTIATSPMRKLLSPKFRWSPRGSFELLCSPEYSADVPIKNAEKQIINPVSGSKLLGPRRIRFLFICCSFLKSRKYHLVSNSLTPSSSRFRSAYTRLLDSRGLTVPQPKTRFLRDAYQL